MYLVPSLTHQSHSCSPFMKRLRNHGEICYRFFQVLYPSIAPCPFVSVSAWICTRARTALEAKVITLLVGTAYFRGKHTSYDQIRESLCHSRSTISSAPHPSEIITHARGASPRACVLLSAQRTQALFCAPRRRAPGVAGQQCRNYSLDRADSHARRASSCTRRPHHRSFRSFICKET